MTENILTKCPSCHAEYTISLDIFSSGIPKARCGLCQNSFDIKQHMVFKSFLHNQNSYSSKNLEFKETSGKHSANLNNNISSQSTLTDNQSPQSRLANSQLANNQISDLNKNLNKTQEFNTNHELTLLTDDNTGHSIPVNKSLINNKSLKSKSVNSKIANISSNNSQKFWLFGSIALALILFIQLIYFYHNTLIKFNSYNKIIHSICDVSGCNLPTTHLNNINISHQSFRVHQNNAAATDIIAIIKNDADNQQLFPFLKIKIYNNQSLLGEFVAQPDDYLITPQRSLGAHQDSVFMLTVPINHKSINNITITPFY